MIIIPFDQKPDTQFFVKYKNFGDQIFTLKNVF
jgi:hypothetical protein